MRPVVPHLSVLVAGALALLSACGSADESSAEAETELVVVTTVAPLTSIAAAVVGDRAEIRGLVPEGISSHTFEPPPSAAEELTDADVVLLNGLQLEEPTLEFAEANVDEGVEIVELGERTIDEDDYVYDFSFPEDEGKPNPHLWTNPPMALRYAEIVRDTMTELDPDGAAGYAANTAAFADEIDRLDAAMRASLATVPPDDRKLLTYHDAYAYFAEDYGWEVIGAIQVADFEEPSPREVADLIDQVRAEDLPAIFGSEVFPSPILEQIGNETGVRYIDVLRDDDLPGEPGEPEHSLLELLRDNYIVITEALGGDAAALDSVDFIVDPPDRARYP